MPDVRSLSLVALRRVSVQADSCVFDTKFDRYIR